MDSLLCSRNRLGSSIGITIFCKYCDSQRRFCSEEAFRKSLVRGSHVQPYPTLGRYTFMKFSWLYYLFRAALIYIRRLSLSPLHFSS